MADTIFKLNDVDYSAHVVADDYKINAEPIYQEWVDGGQVKHRDVVAQKVKGTMQMYFKTESELQTFLTALNNAVTSAHTYPVKLMVNNAIGTTLVSKNVFMDFKPVRQRDATWADTFKVFEVTIEEP